MSIHRIRFSDIEKIDILVTKKMSDDSIIKKYNPDYLLNLALYDMATGENITYLKDENKPSGFLFSSNGIGITQDNKVVWCNKDEAYKSDYIRDYCSGSPVLVVDGKKSIDWGNKYSQYVGGSSHYRTYVGFNDNELFIGCTDTKYSIDALADFCVKSGMKYALNEDGNGSQSLWVNGKAIKNTVRNNASWLLIWVKKQPTIIKPEKEDDEMVIKEGIVVNGEKIEFNTITKDGVTYMEFRKLAELLGCQVGYDAATKTKSLVKR